MSKKELKLPCRIGIPKGLPGFQADLSLASLLGLVLEGVEEEEGNVRVSRWGVPAKAKSIFKSFANIFIP